MLPRMAGSAQTYKSMSFIWIVWSTLYVYLWVDPNSNMHKWYSGNDISLPPRISQVRSWAVTVTYFVFFRCTFMNSSSIALDCKLFFFRIWKLWKIFKYIVETNIHFYLIIWISFVIINIIIIWYFVCSFEESINAK